MALANDQATTRRMADITRDLQAAFAHDQAGRRDRAESLYRKVLQKDPDNADALHLLGVLAHERGRHARAIQLIERAIAILPDFPAARLNLGNAYRMSGSLAQAAESYRRAIALRPDYAIAHCDLAAVFNDDGDFAAGLESADRAIALQPDLAEAHVNRATALLGLRRLAEAEAEFRRALALQPDRTEVLSALGAVLGGLGRADEALACFRRALELEPDFTTAHRVLALSGQLPRDEAQLQRLGAILDNRDHAPLDRVVAGFALGKLLDNAGRYDEAFARFAEANALYLQKLAKTEERFDPEALRHEVDGLIERCTPALFAQAAGAGLHSELPVFIVGMPRSGTSLVEQIAVSHSRVTSVGEGKEISELTASVLTRAQRAAPQEENEDLTLRLAGEHVALLQGMGGEAVRVIDKMPDNIFYLGVVAPLFPAARVIFCRRDLRDTCLSCFFELFAEGSQFAYDLADCGRRALEIERLAEHWLNVLPLATLTIDYEALIEDPEGQSRRLIDAGPRLGAWMSDFHRSERPFFTGSTWQVRQRIHRRSVGRWRHYERHLGPLFDVLQRGAPQAAAK